MNRFLPFLIALPISLFLFYRGAKAKPTRKELAYLFGSGFLIGVTGIYLLKPDLEFMQRAFYVVGGILGGVLSMARIPLDMQRIERQKAQLNRRE